VHGDGSEHEYAAVPDYVEPKGRNAMPAMSTPCWPKVQEGVEVIVEQDHRPVAVIKTPQGRGRKISECIALAKAYEEKLGYTPIPDAGFAADVQAAVNGHREPLDPPTRD